MLKTDQRYNGMSSPYTRDDVKSEIGFKYLHNQNKHSESNDSPLINTDKEHLPSGSVSLQDRVIPFPVVVKKEAEAFENDIHSIIGVSQNKFTSNIPQKRNDKSTYHESLQRIGGADVSYNQYQQHWFSGSLERLKLEDKSREERLEITRYELRRHLKQILRSNLGKANTYITEDTLLSSSSLKSNPYPPLLLLQQNHSYSDYNKLVSARTCDVEKCTGQALPCTRHCTLHIMHNTDQVLFNYCTAKFADNTQCSIPVFDITHELPLCPEHARKRDNYRMYQEAKPKKLRKKVKPSAMIRPQKRNKKKKKPPTKPPEVISTPKVEEVHEEAHGLAGDMVEQVLALQEPDGLELVSVEQALVTQASNLLEESEINNVLSTIQADEFSDFFTVNRNGEYEPSREETEELERALAAVDNDVKSLEKLSQSQGLLDSFLDEHTLVESLVQIPDVFHNGYTSCGDNIVSQTSRLLSVEPHSQS